MGKELTFECRNIEDGDLLAKIDKAVVAAACKVRDDAKKAFMANKSQYKYATKNYDALASGIMIGKLKGDAIKVHALGNNQKGSNTYKTRFFVGSTIYRTQTKQQGKSIKPYTKGYIKGNDAIDKAVNSNGNTLNQYINNVLNK